MLETEKLVERVAGVVLVAPEKLRFDLVGPGREGVHDRQVPVHDRVEHGVVYPRRRRDEPVPSLQLLPHSTKLLYGLRMHANDVVLTHVHVYLDGAQAALLLEDAEREQDREEIPAVIVDLGQVALGEAVLDREIVETERLREEPRVRSVLPAVLAGDVAPHDSVLVREVPR